jgi:hypothetical protein
VIARSALLLASIALVLASRADRAPAWESSVRISGGDRALAPELGSNSSGDLLVVWDQEVGAACPTQPASPACVHIVEAAPRQADGAWQPLVEITRPGVDARPTAAVGDAGDGAIVWVHDIGRDRVLQAVYRHGRSGAWPEPSDISETSLEVRDHAIALDANGNAVAVWAERREATFAVKAATRSAISGAWGAPALLSTPGASVTSGPSLAHAPTGAAIVAWAEGASVVRVAHGDATTGVWSAPTDLSRWSTPVQGFVQAAVNPAGDVAVAWVQQRAGGSVERVHVAYRRRGGGWGAPMDLPTLRSGAASKPAVGVDGAGNVVVAWIADGGVEAAVRSPAGGSWTAPSLISAPTRASELRLAVDQSGNAVAAWASEVAGAVQTALRPGASGQWARPLTMSAPPSDSPRITLDSSGAGLAVWSVRLGERAAVDTSRLEGTAVITRLRVPTRAALGARTSFLVDYVPWAAPLTGSPEWQFGDGGSATGARVAHAYAGFGRYAVIVKQTDGKGRTSTGTATIVVGAPRNTRRPSIEGKVVVGRKLTCLHGGWSGERPIGFAYRWLRDGHDIPGATRSRYRVRPDDRGEDLGCRVRATNALGITPASARPVHVGF